MDSNQRKLLSLLAVLAPCFGASIDGKVTDASGSPTRATVYLMLLGSSANYHTKTRTDGTFGYFGLPGGDYTVWADSKSRKFSPAIIKILSSEDHIVSLDLMLSENHAPNTDRVEAPVVMQPDIVRGCVTLSEIAFRPFWISRVERNSQAHTQTLQATIINDCGQPVHVMITLGYFSGSGLQLDARPHFATVATGSRYLFTQGIECSPCTVNDLTNRMAIIDVGAH